MSSNARLVDRTIALFEQGLEQAERGKFEAAAEIFSRVLQVHEQLGRVDLDGAEGTLPMETTLGNLSLQYRSLGDFGRMRAVASTFVEWLPGCPRGHLDHAIALKHTGEPGEALRAIERGIALDERDSDLHYERACILAVAGRLEDALGSVERALRVGADPRALVADDELASLRTSERFVLLTGSAFHVECLTQRLRDLDAELVTLAAQNPAWLSGADAVDVFEEALPVVRELLANSEELAAAPRRDRGDGGLVIDATRSDPKAVALLEAIVGCERLWHAIPFLNELARADLPNLSPDDARLELGLMDSPRPWIDLLRRIGSSEDPDVASMLGVSEAVLARHPAISEVWMDKAVALLWSGALAEALTSIDEAVRLEPTSGPAHLNRAYILAALDRPPEEVIGSLEAAVRCEPELSRNLADDESFARLRGRPQFDALARLN